MKCWFCNTCLEVLWNYIMQRYQNVFQQRTSAIFSKLSFYHQISTNNVRVRHDTSFYTASENYCTRVPHISEKSWTIVFFYHQSWTNPLFHWPVLDIQPWASIRTSAAMPTARSKRFHCISSKRHHHHRIFKIRLSEERITCGSLVRDGLIKE